MRAITIKTALGRLPTLLRTAEPQLVSGSRPLLDPALQRLWDRWFVVVLAVFAVPLAVAVFSDAALTWDGAYLLFWTLDTGTPFVGHDRLLDAPIHRPVLWVNSLTDSLAVLRATFGVVHVITPLVALALSWWVVRKDAPALIFWPVLALGLALLPGQINFISEGIKTNQLIWPVLLAVLIGLPARTVPMVAVVAVAIMFLHPVSAVVLGAVAAAALVMGFLQPANRDRLYPLAACLLLASLLRYSMIAESYETGEMNVGTFKRQWRNSATGLPGLSLILTFATAAIVLGASLVRSIPRWLPAVPLVMVAGAGGVLTIWAKEPARWWDALEFRGPAIVVTLALAGMAALDGFAAAWFRDDRLRTLPPIRRATGQAVAVAFAIVLSTQSIQYGRVISDMNEALAASPSPCLVMSTLPNMPESPLNLWSTPSLSLLYQGWRPAKIVLPEQGCERARDEGVIPLIAPGSDYESNHIDLLPLQWELGGQGSCWWQERSGWHGVERTEIGRRRWSPGRGVIRVFVSEPGALSFRGLITTFRTPNTISVSVNGVEQQTIAFTSSPEESAGRLTIQLERGENIIEFTSANDPAPAAGDPRPLAFSLLNVKPEFDGAACSLHR